MASPSLVWFRKDLRLSDNPALDAAITRGGPILCVFILDEATEGAAPLGGASGWWLHQSLVALAADIETRGGRLILRRGDATAILPEMCAEADVGAVYWNRCYEPDAITRDTALKERLKADNRTVGSFNGTLLHEPWRIKTKAGGPYGVFTPFWRAECAAGDPPAPVPAPKEIPGPDGLPAGDSLDGWGLLPTAPDWANGFREMWAPGEAGARDRLDRFLARHAASYENTRDRPDDPDGTSRLSPHLAFGELSAREIWHIARNRLAASGGVGETGVWAFLRELGWRDFNYNLLFHNPSLPAANYNGKFDAFPWREDANALKAWQAGRTGYPMVDAGMRELWQTGFMHNRVRMIVASFLVKHLLIHWKEGEAWFRDTLVDADLASNSANWQWTAGCGADAAPYFRIFNPITQGEKFDPDGAYVRRWVPELADLPTKFLHKPWTAPADLLKGAGIHLGQTYPKPIVDHAEARKRALAAYESVKGAA